MKQSIEDVVNGTMQQVKFSGIKEHTVLLYQDVSNTIIHYVKEKGDGSYSEMILDNYQANAEKRYINQEICLGYLRFIKRVVRMLRSYAETEIIDVSRAVLKKRYHPSALHKDLIGKILDNKALRGGSRNEMDIVMRHFFCFTEEAGIIDTNISDTDFFKFMEMVSETNKGSIGRTFRALKYISAYFRKYQIADLKSDISMLKMKSAPVRLIPPYSQDEIKRMISCIDTSTSVGLRDYAILVMAFETGLRAIDIIKMKFQDIKWKTAEVQIIQSKTKAPLQLPLNATVMNAVADYILHVRPKSDISEIFLTTKAPIKAIARSSSLDCILEKYRQISSVEKKPQRAFHSLRRTFATELSLAGVPLPTISQMLGHKKIDEDKPYLSYNRTQVSFCAMDFSEIPITGGIYASNHISVGVGGMI
ncbi:site-specific integrase [Clostridium sp.]|uniref:site-specific integrase n=1 Tax=Clostridium sp. TaxID=1506 RepID=UPI003D6D670A